MNQSGHTHAGCSAVVSSVLQLSVSTLCSVGISNGSACFIHSLHVALPISYTVVVNPQGTTTGSVTVLLNTFADVTGGTISAGTPVTATTTVAGQNALY